eukprot:g4807.t1
MLSETERETENEVIGKMQAMKRSKDCKGLVRLMKTFEDTSNMYRTFCIKTIGELAKDEKLREVLGDSGGVESVIQVMQAYENEEKVQEAGCNTLMNLTNGEQGNQNDKLGNIIGSFDGIAVIIRAMRTFPKHSKIQRLSCHALRNLARNTKNKDIIGSSGGIQLVVRAMETFPGKVEVQQWGCGALGNLAYHNAENRSVIGKSNAVRLIVRAMEKFEDIAEFQGFSCYALGRIAMQSPRNKQIIREVGGLARICEAVRLYSKVGDLKRCGKLAISEILRASKKYFQVDLGLTFSAISVQVFGYWRNALRKITLARRESLPSEIRISRVLWAELLEKKLLEWLREMLSLPTATADKDDGDLRKTIANGVVLCRLMQRIVGPQAIKKVHEKCCPGSLQARDNLAQFLSACDLYFSMGDEFKFSTEYLNDDASSASSFKRRVHMRLVNSCLLTFIARAHILRGNFELPRIPELRNIVARAEVGEKEEDDVDAPTSPSPSILHVTRTLDAAALRRSEHRASIFASSAPVEAKVRDHIRAGGNSPSSKADDSSSQRRAWYKRAQRRGLGHNGHLRGHWRGSLRVEAAAATVRSAAAVDAADASKAEDGDTAAVSLSSSPSSEVAEASKTSLQPFHQVDVVLDGDTPDLVLYVDEYTTTTSALKSMIVDQIGLRSEHFVLKTGRAGGRVLEDDIFLTQILRDDAFEDNDGDDDVFTVRLCPREVHTLMKNEDEATTSKNAVKESDLLRIRVGDSEVVCGAEQSIEELLYLFSLTCSWLDSEHPRPFRLRKVAEKDDVGGGLVLNNSKTLKSLSVSSGDAFSLVGFVSVVHPYRPSTYSGSWVNLGSESVKDFRGRVAEALQQFRPETVGDRGDDYKLRIFLLVPGEDEDGEPQKGQELHEESDSLLRDIEANVTIPSGETLGYPAFFDGARVAAEWSRTTDDVVVTDMPTRSTEGKEVAKVGMEEESSATTDR